MTSRGCTGPRTTTTSTSTARSATRPWSRTDQWLDEVSDLDAMAVTPHGEQASVRDILIHMIEEYARHCGHADLLRECIDGRTGQ